MKLTVIFCDTIHVAMANGEAVRWRVTVDLTPEQAEALKIPEGNTYAHRGPAFIEDEPAAAAKEESDG